MYGVPPPPAGYYAQPPRRSSAGKWVLIGCGIALLLGLLVGALLVVAGMGVWNGLSKNPQTQAAFYDTTVAQQDLKLSAGLTRYRQCSTLQCKRTEGRNVATEVRAYRQLLRTFPVPACMSSADSHLYPALDEYLSYFKATSAAQTDSDIPPVSQLDQADKDYQAGVAMVRTNPCNLTAPSS